LAFPFLSFELTNIESTPDMKKVLIASTLIVLATICSCQKQDSAAEQQLAQRKAQLDARETALNERERALEEREKAVANRRRVPADARSSRPSRDLAELQAEREKKLQQLPPELRALIPPPGQVNPARTRNPGDATQQQSDGQTPNPEQVQAERERKLQQLPSELRALIPDAGRLNPARAEKNRLKQERLTPTQNGPEDLQSQRQRRLEAIQKSQISGATASPAETPSPTPSPAVQTVSPIPSPTPQ
jgi:DNA repair exonuclease SbcCD ATPase subunit